MHVVPQKAQMDQSESPITGVPFVPAFRMDQALFCTRVECACFKLTVAVRTESPLASRSSICGQRGDVGISQIGIVLEEVHPPLQKIVTSDGEGIVSVASVFFYSSPLVTDGCPCTRLQVVSRQRKNAENVEGDFRSLTSLSQSPR